MDLIGSLASSLGIDKTAAEAVAGSALKLVKGAVEKEEGGDEASTGLAAAVPELSKWTEVASKATGGDGGLLGGLLGGGGGDALTDIIGAIGGQDAANAAALVQILDRFGLDADKAVVAAPLLLSFLKDRLSPELLGIALKAAPFLAGGGHKEKEADGPDLGALGGLLGGLFD